LLLGSLLLLLLLLLLRSAQRARRWLRHIGLHVLLLLLG
jgi:hypothetical protein